MSVIPMRKPAEYVPYPPPSQEGAYTPPPCPRCGEPLTRISRGLAGRLISLFKPVRRYRCDSPLCHWSGHLRFPLK